MDTADVEEEVDKAIEVARRQFRTSLVEVGGEIQDDGVGVWEAERRFSAAIIEFACRLLPVLLTLYDHGAKYVEYEGDIWRRGTEKKPKIYHTGSTRADALQEASHQPPACRQRPRRGDMQAARPGAYETQRPTVDEAGGPTGAEPPLADPVGRLVNGHVCADDQGCRRQHRTGRPAMRGLRCVTTAACARCFERRDPHPCDQSWGLGEHCVVRLLKTYSEGDLS